MAEQKLSIKKIAELAGVSTATVSRVINNNGRFSEETGRRVREIIASYDYEPNHFARGLRRNKGQSIGVIVPDITNEFFSSLISSLQQELFKQNYHIVIYNTSESKIIEQKSLAHLRAQKVSGVVYINGHAEIEKDFLKDIPTVYIDRKPELNLREDTVFISSDNEKGGYLATRELIENQCKKIAVITERCNTFVTLERLAGYERACQEAGIKTNSSLIFSPEEIRYEAAYKLTNRLIKDKVDFDGLFCETDWLASGALSAMRDNHISLPEDKKLVGFDNISISFLCQQPFTTIHQDTKKMGICSAKALLQMIAGEKPHDRVKLMAVKLIKRQTTYQNN